MRVLIALALCALLPACGGGGTALPQVITVEINADSICSATGIKTTCAQMLPADWVVDDRAIAGLTLHSLYTGYAEVWAGSPPGKNGPQPPFVLAPHRSAFVVVAMGGNDAYEARDPATFEAELRAILLHIVAIGKTPIVTGIVPFRAGPPGFDTATVARALVLNAITHRVAAELGVIDAHWDTVPFDPNADTVDGMHRTEPSLRRLVQRLISTMKTTLT